jgi:hypothetical protein
MQGPVASSPGGVFCSSYLTQEISMNLSKIVFLLCIISLAGSCEDDHPSLEWEPYIFELPDGRRVEGLGARHGDTLLINGDIVIPAAEEWHTDGNVTSGGVWPNRTVVYQFDPSVDAATRQSVLNAMNPWRQAGINFLQRTNQYYYVNIRGAYYPEYPWVCGATVGFQMTNTYYAASACRVRDYVHEWGHIIGLHHEHNRHDRDQYVTILSSDPGFNIVGTAGYEWGPYDFGSIMHYDAYGRNSDGSINFGQILIQPRDGRHPSSFGFNETPSAGDLDAVQGLYWTEPPCNPLCP